MDLLSDFMRHFSAGSLKNILASFILLSFSQALFCQKKMISTADFDIYIKDTLLLDASQMELLSSAELSVQKTLLFKAKTDGFKTYYYIDGWKNCMGRTLNKKREGDWTSWYDSGGISSTIHYINGLREDSCTYWFKNGSLNATGQYKNDLKEGEWVFYNADGTFKGLYYYRKGAIDKR